MLRTLTPLLALLPLLLPAPASAQVSTLPGWIDTIAGTWLTTTILPVTLSCIPTLGTGACELAGLLIYAVRQGQLLIGALAFVIIVVAGFRLIISQAEEALATARRSVLGAVIGLFLVFVTEPVVDALYGGFTIPSGTVLNPGNIAPAAGILSDELLGIIRWVETLVAIVVIGLLVVQAVYVLGSFGAEETIRKAYRAVFSSMAGILLIVFDRAIAALFGYATIGALPGIPTTQPFFVEVFGFLRFILLFVAIILIAVILYAGGLMLLHFGNEELLNKGKTILTNAAIGLVLIILCFVLTSTVILGIT